MIMKFFLKVITGLEDTKKKNKLFKFKNLKNFRNNSLSYGLDTRVGSHENQKRIYNEIVKKIGLDFVDKHLSKKPPI